MAYMSQDKKKSLSVGIKAVLKKYNVKASIAVRNHSTLLVNIKSSSIDFDLGDRDYAQMHRVGDADTTANNFLKELFAAMNGNDEHSNHNNSDVQSDYFDVGWYAYINVGQWDKPYIKTA